MSLVLEEADRYLNSEDLGRPMDKILLLLSVIMLFSGCEKTCSEITGCWVLIDRIQDPPLGSISIRPEDEQFIYFHAVGNGNTASEAHQSAEMAVVQLASSSIYQEIFLRVARAQGQ